MKILEVFEVYAVSKKGVSSSTGETFRYKTDAKAYRDSLISQGTKAVVSRSKHHRHGPSKVQGDES